jgi:hypothetical protein
MTVTLNTKNTLSGSSMPRHRRGVYLQQCGNFRSAQVIRSSVEWNRHVEALTC